MCLTHMLLDDDPSDIFCFYFISLPLWSLLLVTLINAHAPLKALVGASGFQVAESVCKQTVILINIR